MTKSIFCVSPLYPHLTLNSWASVGLGISPIVKHMWQCKMFVVVKSRIDTWTEQSLPGLGFTAVNGKTQLPSKAEEFGL